MEWNQPKSKIPGICFTDELKQNMARETTNATWHSCPKIVDFVLNHSFLGFIAKSTRQSC